MPRLTRLAGPRLCALTLVLLFAACTGMAAVAQTAAPAVKITEYVEQSFPLPATIEARESPAQDAAVLVRLRQGMSLKVKGVVDGDQWLQVELPDGRLGYVRANEIPAVLSSSASLPPAADSGTAVTAAPPASAGSGTPPATPPPDQGANENTETTATAELPPSIQFSSVDQAMKVEHDTAVFVAPSHDAPRIYDVRAGVVVEVVAVSSDNAWAWVTTESSDPAYVAMTDLTAATAGEIKAVAAAFPQRLSGRATVLATTGDLRVGDHELKLFGIEGMGPPFTQQLQTLLDRHGRSLECERKGGEYLCRTAGKLDLAEEALRDGLARPGPAASPDYVKASETARSGKRGTWSE